MRFPCESVFCDSCLSDARKKLSEFNSFRVRKPTLCNKLGGYLARMDWLLETMLSFNLKQNFALKKNKIKT